MEPLPENEFVKIFITEHLNWRQASKLYGIPRHRYHLTRLTYLDKYREQLKRARAEHYARSKRGNKHGARDAPSIVLDDKELAAKLARGWTVHRLAKHYTCSEFMVRQNIRFHNIPYQTATRVPVFIGKASEELLAKLDGLAPGLLGAAASFYKDPEAFFQKAYAAHLQLMEVLRLSKRIGKARSNYYSKGQPSNMCWSTNASEAELAQALTDQGTPHIRQPTVGPNKKGALRADFLVADRLYVEIDGEYHETPAGRRIDRKKEAYIAKTKRALLRITTRDVATRLPWVMTEIRRRLHTE